MIRQTITCDICGSEKKQTNHWYVAVHHGGELRVIGWQGKKTQRVNAKHLCGQKCVHRLLDEFLAGAATQEPGEPKAVGEKSTTYSSSLPDAEKAATAPGRASYPASKLSYVMETSFRESAMSLEESAMLNEESSARLITPTVPTPSAAPQYSAMAVVGAARSTRNATSNVASLDLGAKYADPKWRAMVWQRHMMSQRQRDLLGPGDSASQGIGSRAHSLGI